MLVGTIGVWESRTAELETYPSGRLLRTPPNAPNDARRLPGPALVRVQPDRPVISLNLITTIPEADVASDPPRKLDLGPIRLGLIRTPGGKPEVLGNPLDYAYPSYARTAGILDISYDPARFSRADLQAGTLVLLADRFGADPILTEEGSEITIETDDRALYLDLYAFESQEASGTIRLLVQEKGLPPTRNVRIFAYEYENRPVQLSGEKRPAFEIGEIPSPRLTLEPAPGMKEGWIFPRDQTTPLNVPVTGTRPGMSLVLFSQSSTAPIAGADWGTAHFAGVRVLPRDQFIGTRYTRDHMLRWEFIYAHVLRFYDLTFPAMSRFLRLNDRAAVEAAIRDRGLFDPKVQPGFHSTHYMPITRDLSRSKRELLAEWSQLVRAAGKPAP